MVGWYDKFQTTRIAIRVGFTFLVLGTTNIWNPKNEKNFWN